MFIICSNTYVERNVFKEKWYAPEKFKTKNHFGISHSICDKQFHLRFIMERRFYAKVS